MQPHSLRASVNDRLVQDEARPQALDLQVILFAALAPLCAVCGFMLAGIAGFAPF